MWTLLAHAITLSALATFLLLFGFAPRAVLRVILFAFPRSDPRRQELLSEIVYIPWWDRPRWVAEQFEIALFEGLRGRLEEFRTRRASKRVQVASYNRRSYLSHGPDSGVDAIAVWDDDIISLQVKNTTNRPVRGHWRVTPGQQALFPIDVKWLDLPGEER